MTRSTRAAGSWSGFGSLLAVSFFGLDPAQPTRFMDFVDPRQGEPLGDGTIRAPRLDSSLVFARYGKSGV